MEDYDEEPDLEEQIFHNNVREQIVSIYANCVSCYCQHTAMLIPISLRNKNVAHKRSLSDAQLTKIICNVFFFCKVGRISWL